ncbi:hypothetical protein OHB12_22820 [Nocardia sp. NBC_01730]|uniref:hypothetical protein n=1 Tax=Nocardia sp. NBC_01730 TaxID=2975998 RepID=UPI002E131712|nr:hypothetical protein OHB12_22820 [Nocardia sp. NBC_01730]
MLKPIAEVRSGIQTDGVLSDEDSYLESNVTQTGTSSFGRPLHGADPIADAIREGVIAGGDGTNYGAIALACCRIGRRRIDP